MRAYISEAYVSSPGKFKFYEESTATGNDLMLEGEFQKARAGNKNGRAYSEFLLRRETDQLREKINARNGHPMGMDHPIPVHNDPNAMQAIQRIGLENACALTTALDFNGDIVYGKAKVLKGDFGTGDKLAAFTRAGFLPAVSSRGIGGDPVMGPNGLVNVPEDYSMICYDFVTDPSTHNAILQESIMEEVFRYEEANKYVRSLWNVMKDFTEKI